MTARRPGRWAVAVAPLLAASLVLTAPSALARPLPAAGSEGLALTATPSSGAAPLKVLFNLTVPAGPLPTLEWAFGDGTYLNGSTTADLRPYHTYDAPGTYPCRVTAAYPRGALNATITIDVSDLLSVVVSASPSTGVAPLSVWLNGTVAGGTGTLVGYQWSFGNGGGGSGLSLRYTYDAPGTYLANLTVTDSANATATASARIVVSTPSGVGGNGGSNDDPIPLTAPVVVSVLVLALGGVAVLAVGLWVRRSRTWLGPPPDAGATAAPDGGPAGPPSGLEEPTAEATDEAGWAPGPDVRGADSGAPEANGLLAGPEAPELTVPAGPPVPAAPRPATLTLQILRHLAGLPRLTGGEAVVPPEFTQAGIAEALGAGQSAISRVLRRLIAAGAVEVATRHVPGSPRRVRVYWLTERGERLGRALRESPEVGSPAGELEPEP